MAIEFPPLPFAKDALEPHMSQKTLEFHYGKHHKKYVDTTNELIKGTPLDKKTLEEIMIASANKQKKLYNNAAQAWNHEFFWNCLTGDTNDPSAELKAEIEKNWESFAEFKTDFTNQAKALFGSGWVWLVKDKKGQIKIRCLPDAGNPLAENKEVPLLTCDVWEHAYYLDYQNERPKFLDGFWKLVNWEFVEANLNQGLENPEFINYGKQKNIPGKEIRI